MYNLMILDDENIIRQGLINSIRWNEHGLNIVAVAENGEKGLKLAQVLKPDIILTDIYMPVMDGIEFSREVRQILPEVIIIFLSGYSEFVYAQRALEFGVFRYLTKPIQEEDLLSVLKDACRDLDDRELEREQIQQLKLLIKDSLPLLKERFFLNLIKGKLKENEIMNKLDYFDISLCEDRFFSIIISLDDFISFAEKQSEDDLNLIKFAIQNISHEIFSEIKSTFFMVEDKPNEIVTVFFYNSNIYANYLPVIYPAMQRIQDYIWRHLQTTVSFGIGRCYSNLAKVNKSYREAEDALEYRTAFAKNSISFIGDIYPSVCYSSSMINLERLNEIIKAVKGGNAELSLIINNEIFDCFKVEVNLKKEQVYIYTIELLVNLERIVLEFSGDVNEVYGAKFSPLMLLNQDKLEIIQDRLRDIILSAINFINSKRKMVNRNFIEKAKEFITENYALEDLNLNTIADSVYVSPGYLSQLFKQVVGESCVEYLTKVRLNKAKTLLKETNLKTYEIAEKVGYSESHYFSTCFKKYIGVSPSDYRDKIAKDLF